MKSFLIVEGNKDVYGFYQEILRENYNCSYVDHASNKVEAFNHAELVDYDVIIANNDMPGMEGMEFYEQLKKEHPSIAKRVAFISSRLEAFYITFFRREERPWIAKPFDKKDFLSLVDKVLTFDENNSNSEGFESERENVRFVKSMECSCVPENLTGRSPGLSVKTTDFSRGGLGIIYKGEKLLPGTMLRTTLEIIGLSNVMASVVWSEKRGKDVYTSGLKWLQPL